MYGDALTLDIYSEKGLQTEECIQEFWKELAGKLRISEAEVQKQNSIRQFLDMKDVARIPEENQIRYMNIDASEYQNREYALGTVENVLEGKPGNMIKKRGGKNNCQKAAGGSGFKKRQDGKIDYPQSKTVSKGREVEGEIIRYDKRKQQLLVQVERKEIGIDINPFQGMNCKEKQKVLLTKSGNDYSIKKLL